MSRIRCSTCHHARPERYDKESESVHCTFDPVWVYISPWGRATFEGVVKLKRDAREHGCSHHTVLSEPMSITRKED